jgi:hypothetical protein
MNRKFTFLAVAAVLALGSALGPAADAQIKVQPRSGSLAPKPNTANPDNQPVIPHAQPAVPAAPGGFKASPTACLPGWSQVELKHDTWGNLSRMTCQSPVIQCPEPAPGYTVSVDVAKQIIDADDGRFRIQYRCTYYRIQG